MINRSFDLTGRVAVVTGACGLLGREHCMTLAEAGATVVVADLHAEATVELARDLGDRHIGLDIDVTDKASVDRARDIVLASLGRVDILINNAAMNDMVEHPTIALEQSRFEQYPLDLWKKVMDVNVTGMFVCCQSFGSLLAQQGRGSIINIASTYGIVAPDQRLYRDAHGTQTFYKSAAYPTSKGAVVMLTRYLAAYWGDRNVRVNTLSPGGVRNGQDEHFVLSYSSRTPLGRMAMPEDYHGAVVFLASDASSYITGHNLVVDGGWTAW